MKPALKFAALFVALVPAATQAHDIWLLPSSTVLSATGYVTVDAAVSNDTFHFTYRPLMLGDGLQTTAPDGSLVQPENLLQGTLRSVFDLNLQQEGTYRIGVTMNALFAGWTEGGEQRRWRGRAEDFARQVPADAVELRVSEAARRVETFVTVGRPTSYEPFGHGLELLPITHPNDLYAGEQAEFRLLVDGMPAAGIEVEVLRGGTRYRDRLEKMAVETDAEGRFAVTWSAPGMYWLEATLSDQRTSIPQAAERRVFYAATFEVLPQ